MEKDWMFYHWLSTSLALLCGSALLVAAAAWGYAPPLEQLPAISSGQLDDPMLQQLLQLLGKVGGLWRAGELFALAVLVVVLLVLGVRAFGKKLHDMIPDDHWADRPFFFLFESKPGGVLLNSATAFAVAMVPMYATDTKVTPELVVPLVVGTGGIVGLATALYGWAKDVVAWFKLRKLKAKEAGEAAAKVAKAGAVVLLLAFPLALGSCTHAQAWRASGETVIALGETFAATGQAMDAMLDRGLVSVQTYRTWAAFCAYWKPAYDEAFKQWANGDATAQQRVAGVLTLLSAELAVWTARSASPEVQPEAKDGGAP